MPIKQSLKLILDENNSVRSGLDETVAAEVLATIQDAPRVFVLGAGRSGLVMRLFAMRLMHLGVQTYVVGETITPAIQAGDLLIACSGSGETLSTCLMAEKSRERGAGLVAITAMPDSRLAKAANHIVLIGAPPKNSRQSGGPSVQYDGSLFEQSAFLFCEALFYEAVEAKGISSTELWSRHANLE